MAARGASPSPSQLPVPASPTYSYASTANPALGSQFDLPLPPPPRPPYPVLTQADLDASQAAYADLLTRAKAYRLALAQLSSAASGFGAALEACARLKEARADALGPPPGAAPLSNSFVNTRGTCTADALLAAAGLHHLIANHEQILSETVYRAFEVPLLHEIDRWRRDVDDENEAYARGVRERSREISRLEREGLRLHRQRRPRDVARFRAHLVELTNRLDGLTTLHADHARALLRDGQEASARVLDASCSLVRAEVDIFESLARKGWAGGGLEDVLDKGVDLFAPTSTIDEGDANTPLMGGGGGGGGTTTSSSSGAKLFSILPGRSILADPAGGDNPGARQKQSADSLLGEQDDRYQSLAGAVSVPPRKGGEGAPAPRPGAGAADTESVLSEPVTRHRGPARPFSPRPVAVDPDELVIGGSGGGSGGGERATTTTTAAAAEPRGEETPPANGGTEAAEGHEPGDYIPEEEEEEDEEDESNAAATPRPSGFKLLGRALDQEEEDEGHPWRDELVGGSHGHGHSAAERRWSITSG